jgi:hypothetical protein
LNAARSWSESAPELERSPRRSSRWRDACGDQHVAGNWSRRLPD